MNSPEQFCEIYSNFLKNVMMHCPVLRFYDSHLGHEQSVVVGVCMSLLRQGFILTEQFDRRLRLLSVCRRRRHFNFHPTPMNTACIRYACSPDRTRTVSWGGEAEESEEYLHRGPLRITPSGDPSSKTHTASSSSSSSLYYLSIYSFVLPTSRTNGGNSNSKIHDSACGTEP